MQNTTLKHASLKCHSIICPKPAIWFGQVFTQTRYIPLFPYRCFCNQTFAPYQSVLQFKRGYQTINIRPPARIIAPEKPMVARYISVPVVPAEMAFCFNCRAIASATIDVNTWRSTTGDIHIVGMTVPSSHNNDKAEARSCNPTTSAVTGVAIVQNTPLIAPEIRIYIFLVGCTMNQRKEDHDSIGSCKHPNDETGQGGTDSTNDRQINPTDCIT